MNECYIQLFAGRSRVFPLPPCLPPSLQASHGTLLIYPALGVMERVIGLAFEDPDSHLDMLDCIRPGQSGMVLQKHLAAQAMDDDLELG